MRSSSLFANGRKVLNRRFRCRRGYRPVAACGWLERLRYERFVDDLTAENPQDGDPIDVTASNPSWGDAAGEMISTTADSNKFLRALVSGKVLRPRELAEMTRTVRAEPLDAAWLGARYGLGLVWIPNSCGGSWAHGGDIPGFMTRNGVSPDGRRSVTVSINTDSLVPAPDAPEVAGDVTADLIEHALCGS
ncbi:serine hydrolase [Thermocrispum sp.]|nr:serine hydrolase [Thermocrispum sp.]